MQPIDGLLKILMTNFRSKKKERLNRSQASRMGKRRFFFRLPWKKNRFSFQLCRSTCHSTHSRSWFRINAIVHWFPHDNLAIRSFKKKTGGSKLLTFRIVQDYLIKFLTIFPFGSDQYVVKVEAGSRRKKGVQYECSVSGNGEGHITGLVAAKVAEQMRISSFAPGVFHIEQLFEPLEFIESLGNNNLRFESNNVTHYRAWTFNQFDNIVVVTSSAT